MAVIDPKVFLEDAYVEAMELIGSGSEIIHGLSEDEEKVLNDLLRYSERARAVIAVTLTSLTYKVIHPEQDIRNHQASITGGYSGRTFDGTYITPFLKAHKFPAMASSGWLTRSFEQKVPYNDSYSGAISPKELKTVFLDVIARIENGADCDAYISFLLQGLILKRNSQVIDLAKPTVLSIHTILSVLDKHFHGTYSADGASRLPVLALYAAYQCLINEVKRFEDKQLLSIESHTSADGSSGRIGDIEIVDEKDRAFEAVEVKHGIGITAATVETAFDKFQSTPVDRYYILSTAAPGNMVEINEAIHRIKNVHGCQVIVNGIIPTISYYLRLLEHTYEFIENYVNLLEVDAALKFEHRYRWNEIIGELQ